MAEAQALNHTYVGTEHVLLGLIHEGEGVAGQVLRNLNVDLDNARTEVLKELDPNFEPEAAETAVPAEAEAKSSAVARNKAEAVTAHLAAT